MLWEQAADYAWYAEIYGWTPEQVEALPDFYRQRVRILHDMVIEIDQNRARASAPAADTSGGKVMRVRYDQ